MQDAAGSAAEQSLANLQRYMQVHHGREVELLDRLKSAYMRTSRDDLIGSHLEQCLMSLATRPSVAGRHEVRGVVITGETGSGKSHAMRRLLSRHPLFAGFATPNSGCAAISVTIPGSCTLRVLGLSLLRATGYPIEDGREHIVWDKVRARLKGAGITTVHLDEVNNLVGTSTRETDKKITNHFKSLLNRPDWPVVLLLSGTPACEPILRSDEELARRMDWIHLTPMVTPRDNAKIAKQLAAFCAVAGIAAPDNLETVIVPKIITAASGRLGVVMELCQDAVVAAAGTGAPLLAAEHFARVLARRTGCTAADNPFITTTWRAEKEGDPTLAAGPYADSTVVGADRAAAGREGR